MGMTPNYSPIIAAMVANAKQQTENNQQILEAQRQKDEVAHQKVQDAAQSRNLDLLQSHNDALAEHNKGMLGVAQQQAEAQEEMNRLNRAKQAYEVSKFLPHLNETLQSMGGKSIAGLPSQQEAQQNEISQIHDQAAAHSSGTAEGALPSELQLGEAKHSQDLESKLQDHAHRMLQIEAEGGNSQNLAKIHGGYQQSVANINGANHLRGIALMHSLGQDDGSGQQASQARDIVDGVFNGNIEWSKLSTDQKRAASTYATANGEMSSIPTNGKDYKAKLDMISKFQTYVDQFRELANNYSADTPGATGKGNANISLGIAGTHGFTVPGSDLDSRIKDLKTIGGDLAKNLEGQSRTAEADNLRQIIGKFDPLVTKVQNNKKLDSQVERMQPIVGNTLVGMTSDRKNKILGDRNVTDFGAIQPIQAQAPNGHMIESHDNKKTWIDSVTKQPIQQPPPGQ